MAVNLDTLSISLNSFDAASDGEFNIGHIKLNEDGTGVCRTNRHKTFEFLNRDTIPPEETLAIKNAFYDALSRELIRWAKKVLGISAPLAAPVTDVVPVRHSLSPRERRKLLPDLQDAFTIVNDAALMEPLVQAKLPTIPDKLNGRTYTEEIRRQHAEYKVREDLTEDCVKPLVIALNEVRPKDARNAELVNKVRAIIGGAEFIGTDASGKRMLNTPQNRKQILDEITKLISQDRVDPSVVAVQNIKLEGFDDDEIEGNLNIDEIEGNV